MTGMEIWTAADMSLSRVDVNGNTSVTHTLKGERDVVLYADHARVMADMRRVLHEKWEILPNEGGTHEANCSCGMGDDPVCEPNRCPFCGCRGLAKERKQTLDAARKVVADIYRYSAYKAMDGKPGWVYQGDPLAAIDELREEKN